MFCEFYQGKVKVKYRFMFILDYINWLFVKSGAKVRFFRNFVNISTVQKTLINHFRHKILFWNKREKKNIFRNKILFAIY
jgi:ribosomal protein L21